jgi:enoyl-CoA hydratase
LSEILYEVRDGTGFMTLNRPQVRNALTFNMYEKLAEIFGAIGLNGEVGAVIISGAGGKAFAAGTDMSQFDAFTKPQDALDYEVTMDRVLGTIEKCPVPTIAAITGACTGGGAAIAAACDVRIADARLKFGFPIARTLGNCLSVGNLNRISSLIGSGRCLEIILTARLIEAEEALACGLVSQILDDSEKVQACAVEMARKMAGHAPLTMRATKEAMRRLRVDGPQAEDSDLVVDTYMSADFQEGRQAFLGKRKPVWRGK